MAAPIQAVEQVCQDVPDFVEEEEVWQFSDIEGDDNDVEDEQGSKVEIGGDCLKQEKDMGSETDDRKLVDYNIQLQQIHPLHNPVVLTHMFEVCPVEVLATFRQVCKLWYQLSLQSWRSSVKITISSEDLTERGREFFWEWPLPFQPQQPNVPRRDIYSTTLRKFLNYVEEPSHDCDLKPYRIFNLREWEIRDWVEQIQIQDFSQLCGPSITTLELTECFFHDLTGFRNTLFRWFPNMRKLILTNFHCRWFVKEPVEGERWREPRLGSQKNLKYFEIDLNHEQLPISWLELFSHYPNMETFKLYNADVEETIEVMLKAMKIVRRHDRRKLQIKHLDILSASLYAQDKISPEVCLLIRDLELPLMTLTIDFGVENDGTKVKDILQWHSMTLQKLDAYRGPISTPYRNFPFDVQLNNLQELVMSDRLSESLSFLRFTPNLKKLVICDVVDDRPPIISTQIVGNTDARLLMNCKLKMCTELRFDYIIAEREMEMLVGYLPNVESLRMPMNEGQFRLVCQKWQNMRNMEILGNMMDDHIITGISEEDAKAFNAAEKEHSTEEGGDGEIPDENREAPVVHYPNITDLKHLRKFKMSNDDVLPTKLMDCSAFHGFLKLPLLQSIHIASQMYDRARDALYAKIPECSVTRLRRYVGIDRHWDSSSSDSD